LTWVAITQPGTWSLINLIAYMNSCMVIGLRSFDSAIDLAEVDAMCDGVAGSTSKRQM